MVKDYSWKETEAEVDIVLPLKGVKASKADILSTERYIKVNYPPYLFEVYLYAEVIEEQCTVKVGNGVIEFRLIKKEIGLWGDLVSKEAESKHVLEEKRAEAVEKVRRVAAEEAEARAKKKREEEQFAIREQMRLEQEQRERIEGEKQEERDRANRELQRWKEEEKRKKAKEQRERDAARQPAGRTESHTKKTKPAAKTPPSSAIWSKTEMPAKKTCAPRKGGSIQVHFTPRAFPTAARESKEAEEQEWLAKQAAARRISKPANSEEGDLNERNPEFLKDRGVNFFKAKNYESAINIFSEAIALNPALPQLFANRAACYLARGELEECISDCCQALELYHPVVPSNQTSRAKVFARRGSAYARNGKLHLALQDYEAAVKLVPGDERLRDDCIRLRQAALEGNR